LKAIVITRPGGPEVLELRELADPVPGPEEVLVRVHASALNRADLLQRRGRHAAPFGSPPDVPGLEFSGLVERTGARVKDLRAGDRVMGILGGGGYAELACVHERLCLPLPASLTWEEGAALPEAFLTAYDALLRQARLAPGETVLLHAAASGVGTAAAQLVTLIGARAIGLSRSPDKRRRLEQLGMWRVLDPGRDDLRDAVVQASGGQGVDVVLDLVGAAAWPLNHELMRERGRLVLLGLLTGSQARVDLELLLRKRLHLAGSVLRTRAVEEKMRLTQAFAHAILPLFDDGRLRPVVHGSFPLEQAAAAHEAMERNVNFGKIVLRVASG
jgi:putative PIG3 family NAD(P)H quinone oxidoreductase